MKIEAFVSRGIWFGTVRAVPKEPQCCERSLDGVAAGEKFPLDANRICGESKSSGRDAARRSLTGAVRHQTVLWIHLLQEKIKGKALKRLELIVRKGELSRLYHNAEILNRVKTN